MTAVTCSDCRQPPATNRSRCAPHLLRAIEGQRKFHYGITTKVRDEMIASQDGKCAICSRVMQFPCIDHDHATGKVRAILCSECNGALGLFRDNPTLLNEALRYLARFSTAP